MRTNFQVGFEPTCISSLQYSVLKISSISYPYQCLFVPSTPKGMGREKIHVLSTELKVEQCHRNFCRGLLRRILRVGESEKLFLLQENAEITIKFLLIIVLKKIINS